MMKYPKSVNILTNTEVKKITETLEITKLLYNSYHLEVNNMINIRSCKTICHF